MEFFVERGPVKIDKDQNLTFALELMEKKKVSRLLVTDEGWVKGILTESDIARRLGSPNERHLKATQIHVSSAMTKELVVIHLTSDLRDAARIMLEFGFSSLPVVDEGEIIGLITKTDVIKALTDSNKTIDAFYTRNPLLTNPGSTVVSANKLMRDNKVHRLLVTNNGMLEGIVTERDIARGFNVYRKALDRAHHPDIRGIKVEHVMTPDPLKITSESTVGEAARLMLDENISGLPVIARDFGILTKTDLVRVVSEGRA